MSPWHIHCRDRGSAGAYLLVILSAVLAMSVLVGAVAVGIGLRQQLHRAADLAALAAAGLHSTTPCADAERVARAHALALTACTWQAGRAEVTLSRTMPGLGVVSATARAGITPP